MTLNAVFYPFLLFILYSVVKSYKHSYSDDEALSFLPESENFLDIKNLFFEVDEIVSIARDFIPNARGVIEPDSILLEKFEDESDAKHLVALHVDIVFLGFPSSAVEAIRETWIKKLYDEIPFMSIFDPFGDAKTNIGDMSFKINYHVIKTSFHVSDSLTRRFNKLSHLFGSVSIWEVNEILEHLAESISSGRGELGESPYSSQSAATVFVLNQPLSLKWSLVNDITENDLMMVSNNDEIISLAQNLLQNSDVKAKNFYSMDSQFSNSFPLDADIFHQKHDVQYPHGYYKDDAMEETDHWATTVNLATDEMHDKSRIERILRTESPFLAPYKYEVSSRLLDYVDRRGNDMESKEELHNCTSMIHQSHGKILWFAKDYVDVPMTHDSLGKTSLFLRPEEVSDNDWLLLGESQNHHLISTQNLRGLGLMQVGHLVLEHQLALSTCPSWVKEFSSHKHEDEKYSDFISSFAQSLFEDYHNIQGVDNCAVMAFEGALYKSLVGVVSQLNNALKNKSHVVVEEEELKDITNKAHQVVAEALQEMLELTLLVDNENSDHLISLYTTARTLPQIENNIVTYLSQLTSLILNAVHSHVTPPGKSSFVANEIHHSKLDQISSNFIHDSWMKSLEYLRNLSESSALEYFRPRWTTSMMKPLFPNDPVLGFNNEEKLCDIAESLSPVEELGLWTSLNPSAFTPSKVDVILYVIHLQESFAPISQSRGSQYGFDYRTYFHELSRFKLKNQEFVLSLHDIDSIHDEMELSVSLVRCMEDRFDPDSQSMKTLLNGRCMLSYLRGIDTKLYSHSLHLPVFLLSVDLATPLMIDDTLSFSSVVGNSVIVIQNSQMKIPNSSLKCGQMSVLKNGRNPLIDALQATVNALGGLLPLHLTHYRSSTTNLSLQKLKELHDYIQRNYGSYEGFYPKEAICRQSRKEESLWGLNPSQFWDWSTTSGDSPMLPTTVDLLPLFSMLDINNFHRIRILRAVALANAISNFEQKFLMERIYHFDDLSGHDQRTTGMKNSVLDYRESILYNIEKAIQRLTKENWAAASYYANHALLLALSSQKILNLTLEQSPNENIKSELPSDLLLQRSSSGGIFSFVKAAFIVVGFVLAGWMMYLWYFDRSLATPRSTKRSYL